MTSRYADDGFTLVEVIVVAGVLSVLAAAVIPRVNQARAKSVEASAIASLRAINSGQTTYATSCGSGSYAPTIVWLSTVPTGSKVPFVGPEFKTDPSKKLNYQFTLTGGTAEAKSPKSCNGLAAGSGRRNYFLAGDPTYLNPAVTPRYFGTTQDGTIYEATTKVRAFYTGAAPSPATPLK